MKRADFLRAVVAAPLAALFGWKLKPKRTVIIFNYVDGIDLDNAVHRRKVEEMMRKYEQRAAMRHVQAAEKWSVES